MRTTRASKEVIRSSIRWAGINRTCPINLCNLLNFKLIYLANTSNKIIARSNIYRAHSNKSRVLCSKCMFNQGTKIFANNNKLMCKFKKWNKCKGNYRKWRISSKRIKSKLFSPNRLQRSKRTKWLKRSCLKTSKMNTNINSKWTNLYKVKYMDLQTKALDKSWIKKWKPLNRYWKKNTSKTPLSNNNFRKS